MFCPHCGYNVADEDQFCRACGKTIAAASATPAPGQTLPGNVGRPAPPAQSAPDWRAPQQPSVIVIRSSKSAGLAGVLSFLWCGLGQIYNGQIGKGVLFIV